MGRAVAAAAEADVAVVVVGTNADWETEGEDRTTMDLPGAQDELIAGSPPSNPRTVVVVNAGSPVTMPWLDDVAAVLQVWFPGEEFGEALADVLFGVVEPGGRLPITIPRALEDTPGVPLPPGRDDRTVYGEGLLIGHRWYDAQGIEPAFPFGHGLGYTTWELGDRARRAATPDVGRHRARRPCATPAAARGSTVVQCYVEPVGGRRRPAGAHAAGLREGARRAGCHRRGTVDASRPRAFSRWDAAAHDWVVVPGEHRVLVGWSSRDLTPVGVSPAAAAGVTGTKRRSPLGENMPSRSTTTCIELGHLHAEHAVGVHLHHGDVGHAAAGTGLHRRSWSAGARPCVEQRRR